MSNLAEKGAANDGKAATPLSPSLLDENEVERSFVSELIRMVMEYHIEEILSCMTLITVVLWRT